MKREILFKAKRSNTGEWIEGYLIIDDGEYFIFNGEWNLSPDSPVPIFIHVIPETACQFTGLKDKNGSLIFEGDILRKQPINEWEKDNYVSFEVFYHDNDHCESSVGFQMNRNHYHGSVCGTEEYYKFIPSNTKKFKIIGNIHDDK